MSLLHDPSPKRDGTSFVLVQINKKTGARLRLTEKRVIGAEKAETELERLRRSLSEDEIKDGLEWKLEPCSAVGRDRLAFGFRRH